MGGRRNAVEHGDRFDLILSCKHVAYLARDCLGSYPFQGDSLFSLYAAIGRGNFEFPGLFLNTIYFFLLVRVIFSSKQRSLLVTLNRGHVVFTARAAARNVDVRPRYTLHHRADARYCVC